MSPAKDRKPFFRSRPFGLGAASGAGFFLAICGLGYLAIRLIVPAQDYNVELVSQGAAVTKAGGGQVQVRTEYVHLMRQVCNEACDDLTFRTKGGGDTRYFVDVLDRKGGCLECTTALPVYGLGGPLVRFDIREGAPRLVEVEYRTSTHAAQP